jgi:hypothetical protein
MSDVKHHSENELSSLSARVAQLEGLLAAQDARARQILPAVRFLSVFLVLVATGMLIAKLTLPNVSNSLGVLFDASIYISITASTILSFLALMLGNQMLPAAQPIEAKQAAAAAG